METVSIIEQEVLIQKYLEEGNREAAVKLVFELVIACAKEKNFKAAETLRDRIFEIDPMALSEIIRSGEIIEREKHDVIDKGHREIWAKLYDELSVEEANALFFSLKTKSFPANTKIFTQGERKPRLFFVNKGRLKIFYVHGEREVLLKVVDKGQLAGEETFFTSTVCTTSMVAETDAELSQLDADVLRHWKSDFPVLESKLHDFASKSKKIKDMIRERELDRRCQKRVPVFGKGEAHLMSTAGAPVGKPFKVDVVDIAQGGACFTVRIAKKETANLLLAQKMNLSYMHPQTDSSKTVNRNGTIVAVRFHPLEDCSISLKFDQMLDAKLLEEFERLASQSAD